MELLCFVFKVWAEDLSQLGCLAARYDASQMILCRVLKRRIAQQPGAAAYPAAYIAAKADQIQVFQIV